MRLLHPGRPVCGAAARGRRAARNRTGVRTALQFQLPRRPRCAESLHRRRIPRSPCPTPCAVRPTCFTNWTAWAFSKASSSPTTIASPTRRSSSPIPPSAPSSCRLSHDAQSRATTVLAAHPQDHNALFAMCMTQGLTTDYMALVEKHQIKSLTPMKRFQPLRAGVAAHRSAVLRCLSHHRHHRIHGRLAAFLRPLVRALRQRAGQQGDRASRIWNWWPKRAITCGRSPKSCWPSPTCAKRSRTRPKQLLASLTQEYPSNPLLRRELEKVESTLPSDR